MTGRTTLSRDTTPLRCNNAVAAVIVLDDGRYLLQHRDDIPGIWYPDHWGCFGGGVDAGEDEFSAMTRELREELGLAVAPRGPIFKMDYEIVGQGRFYRNYFEVALPPEALARIELGEGQKFAAFPAASALDDLRMTPYDAFALYLHLRGESIDIVS